MTQDMEMAEDILEEVEEEENLELESNEDPLGLDNMFSSQQSQDSGLVEMPSMDLGLDF